MVVDLRAIAGANQDSVARVLGEPSRVGPIPEGAIKGHYSPETISDTLLGGASIEVAYVDGRADWITIKGQPGMTFTPAVLRSLGLQDAPPSFSNAHVIVWTEIAGFKEIRASPQQGRGIDFIYVNVFTSP